MRYYSVIGLLERFSRFLKNRETITRGFEENFNVRHASSQRHVSLIAYCVMPTHLHLVLKQLAPKGIEIYMSNLLNSYARYFNLRRERKGPLWMGRFKNVRIENDEQLIHVTRYVHLNPVSAGLIKNAADWEHSSYKEYIDKDNSRFPMCDFRDLISTSPQEYRDFVNSHAEAQRELALIKHLKLD